MNGSHQNDWNNQVSSIREFLARATTELSGAHVVAATKDDNANYSQLGSDFGSLTCEFEACEQKDAPFRLFAVPQHPREPHSAQ